MDVIPASVTPEEFAVLVRRAGLPLEPAQQATLYGVYGNFEAMLARLRLPLETPRPRGAEPGHIFVPQEGWPAQQEGAGS